MKYLYPIAIIVLLLFSIINFTNRNKLKQHITICDVKNQKLKNDINVYINSFLGLSTKNQRLEMVSVTGDTISFMNAKKNSLVFYFPPLECKTCIDQNIFEIISFAKRMDSKKMYVITNKENERYMKIVSRVNKNTNVNFGFFSNPITIPKSCYFIVFESGKVSNAFYPDKNNFEATQKYLKQAAKLLK